jgi:hypothetical protein
MFKIQIFSFQVSLHSKAKPYGLLHVPKNYPASDGLSATRNGSRQIDFD